MFASFPARCGIVLTAVGLIAATPVPAPSLPAADVSPLIQLLANGADITIDFIRHGESADNVAGILGTVPPGAALTDVGRDQAVDVGNLLYGGANPTGIQITSADDVYASEFLRAQQTAVGAVHVLGQLGFGGNGTVVFAAVGSGGSKGTVKEYVGFIAVNGDCHTGSNCVVGIGG